MPEPTPRIAKPARPIPGPFNRFIQAVFWPISFWPSFTHLEEHPADDYVERTTPIFGTAIGFWVCVASIVVLEISRQTGVLTHIEADGEGATVRVFSHSADTALSVLWVFLPVLYAVGFWMFNSREDDYPN